MSGQYFCVVSKTLISLFMAKQVNLNGCYETPFEFEADQSWSQTWTLSSSKLDANTKYNGLMEHKQQMFHTDISSQRADEIIACTELRSSVQPFKAEIKHTMATDVLIHNDSHKLYYHRLQTLDVTVDVMKSKMWISKITSTQEITIPEHALL